MNKLLVNCRIDTWKTADFGSTSEDTQYCLCIGMDLYIEVSCAREKIKGSTSAMLLAMELNALKGAMI